MAESPAKRQGRALCAALCVGACLIGGTLLAPIAQAAEQISAFQTTSSNSDAGGHPDLATSFELEAPGAPEAAQNVTFNAPQGVFGNINAITQCAPADFALQQCPSNAQAGLVTVYANYGGNAKDLLGTAPLYNLVPQVGQTALFALIVPTLRIPIQIPVTVRTGSDFGLRFTIADITQTAPLAAAKLTIWGLPAAAEHNAERFPKGAPGEPAGCAGLADTSCLSGETIASLPLNALTDNPTTCPGQPLLTRLEVQTYQDPEHPAEAQSSYPPIEGCEKETFKPLLEAAPTTAQTDSASGLNLDLSAKQFAGLTSTPSEIRSATVTFPPGFTINPDAADGQSMCTEEAANFGSDGPSACPDNAKIGTVAITSPSFDQPLIGSLYIGEPRPGDQYRLFLIASGFGMNVKLAGSFKPNPETGQLTAHFDELPQAPFEAFQLHLFSGERALMATPTRCAIYTVNAEFTPWDEALAPVRSAQVFGLSQGPHGTQCPGQVRPFEPSLEAGTSNPAAGGFSSFTLKLDRQDGDQYLGKLNFTMPPGLTADLRGITYCPEADIAAAANTPGRVEQADPSCPASSQIGTTNVAAGPGIHPFHAIGAIYFAGPFEGAPLSLVAITPALAGPYDYGTVVIRVAIHVDPLDAHVVADSETVPEIIGGIPIRMREIRVNIDREHFMINPTNCSPFTAGSEGIGDQGTAVAFTSPFQVVNCATLPFEPKMAITQLGGHKMTARSKDPSLQIDLTTRPGDANIRSVTVTLPNAFEIDQAHLGNICDRAELAADECAGRQAIGFAKTETPLLEKPLEGRVYAVSGYGVLPHLAFILGGQVTIVPQAESSTVAGGRLKTVVPVVPDAPIGHFRFTLYGGAEGYIANTRSLCAAPTTTAVVFAAQNGRTESQQVKTKVACRPAKHKHRAPRRKRHR